MEVSENGIKNSISGKGVVVINPSAWGHLKPSSYCDVGRFFYRVFKFWATLCRSLFKMM